MKITEIEVGEIFVPLAKPFKTALRTVENVEDIVVRITTDTGAAGYGEAPPTAVITGDTKGSIRCAIEDFIRPALLGMEIEDLDGIMYRLHSSIVKNTSAKAAVDMAVYDLYAQRFGAPLYQLLGGAGDTVETDITISVNPVPQMVADSLEAVQQGYKILKIKVGKDGLADVARIAGIRKAVGSGIRIGQGRPGAQALEEIGAVVEGYYAAANARTLAQKAGVEMPIAQAAYEVLYEGRDPKLVVIDLMGRAKRSELEESWS